jgi:membrane-associated phospholipid phosphatase
MLNLAVVKALVTDLVSRATNDVSVPESGPLARNSRVIWVVIAAMAVTTIIGYWSAGLLFAWVTFKTIALCALPCLAVSWYYQRLRPDPYIGFATEVFAQLLLALTLGAALSYPLATTGFPYCDALLDSADKWMGLDWRAYLHFINDTPLLSTITHLAYNSMLFQLVVLFIVLVPTSRFVRLQQFVLANALGLCIALAVFTFVPAGGIYGFLQIAHSEYLNVSPIMTTDQKIYLDALRSGEHMLIDEMSGLITFPSFHTAWAIFFAWAFYPVKRLRAAAILLNLVVLAATPVQGAHYFIDLVGGAIVAAISIYGAVGLTRAAHRTRPVVAQPRPQDDAVNGTLIA